MWSRVDAVDVFGDVVVQDTVAVDANGNGEAKPASSLPTIANL